MDSFLLCLILVALIALGGREQVMVAQLSDALAVRAGPILQRPVPLLATGIACAALSTAAMTWAAGAIAGLLPPRAAWMLVAFALALAAAELGWAAIVRPRRTAPPREPTRAFGAIAIVLLWRQLGDGARFVIFAFAAQATYPLTALLGGALGGAIAVGAGWMLGAEALARWPLRWIRLTLAAGLIVAALFIGLDARYGV
ncbi:MAG: hypothetical protein V2J51_10450 [Erythrobacter sp.]|jgi:putative Ca2+/H+ antiporter (TMEM165/GDT1 family)|nr:hypothetical protein [Erythrobacter sp.]